MNSNVEVLSFDVVYRENYDRLLNFVKYSTFGNVDLSEEITSDTFVRVCKHLKNFDSSKAKLFTWICNIAKNLLIDHHRKQKNAFVTTSIDQNVDSEGRSVFNLESPFLTPEQTIEKNELGEDIVNAICNLKESQQKIADLYFIGQYTYDEISDELNIPLGSVKGSIFRIREQLQCSLQKYRTNDVNNKITA
jgi:RNA polymerase sigma-70 factor (ECF subfamily)